MTRDQIDTFLLDNYRTLREPEYLFGIDCNQPTAEQFEKAPLRVLVVFLSPIAIRTISMTYSCLRYSVEQATDGAAFVDYCGFPEKDNVNIFREKGVPYLFGNVSHAPIQDYDLVLMSSAVHLESLNIPHMLHYSGVPLSYEKRLARDDLPLIIFGGANASEAGIVFGPVDGGNSLVDMGMFGLAEAGLDIFVKELFEKFYKDRSRDTRIDKKAILEFSKKKSSVRNKIYHPLAYSFEWDKNFRITKHEKVDPDAPDRVKVGRLENNFYNHFKRKNFYLSGRNVHDLDIIISQGCSGNGLCSFCHEAHFAGGWRENSYDQIISDMRALKASSAPSSGSFMSFNCNFHSDFFRLVAGASQEFSRVSIINMRADVLGTDKKYLELAKKMNMMRVSMAVEGIGDRVRNKILNKNLNKVQLLQAARNAFEGKFIGLKLGYIITGQETEEDYADFLDEVDAILAERDRVGSKTLIRMTFSPLIIYHQTPLRWQPRKTAYDSLTAKKTIKPLLDELTSRGIRVKVHGNGPSIYIEQLMMDGGRALTQWMADFALIKDKSYYAFFVKHHLDAAIDLLHKYGYPIEAIFRSHNADEFYWMDDVEFTSPKNFAKWKQQHQANDFSEKPCLKTPANLKPKCSTCGLCTPAMRKLNTTRDLSHDISVDQAIEALSQNRIVDTTRIVFNNYMDLMSIDTASVLITTKIFETCPDLVDVFHSVGKNTASWHSRLNSRLWSTGMFTFELHWKERVDVGYIQASLNKINSLMESVKVLEIYQGYTGISIPSKFQSTFVLTTEQMSVSRLKASRDRYNGFVKVPSKVMNMKLSTEDFAFPDLFDHVRYFQNGNILRIILTIPSDLNPYLIAQSLSGWSLAKCYENFKTTVLDSGFVIDSRCSCGRSSYFSINHNRDMGKCFVCKSDQLYRNTFKDRK